MQQIITSLNGCLPPPKNYRDHWFMDMYINAEPVGIDPLTNQLIYWGDGHEIACLLEDNPDFNIPF